MNKNLKRTIILISIIFLALISISSISANDLNSANETITSEDSNLKEVNIENNVLTSENSSLEEVTAVSEVENEIEITDVYVKNDAENNGNGSEDFPFKTMKEAIDYGNNNQNLVIIHIHSGIYNETNITITNNMIIKSYNGEVVLDGNNQGWFFYSNNSNNNLSLIGLTFKNGIRYDYYDSTEGGVVKTKGHIDVVNCTFESNFGGTGGGIHSENGANIINSTFKNNKAEYNGAGIYNIYGQTNIINCNFHNNTAKRQGGAVRIQGDTYIENSTFTDNYAGTGNYAGNGGAVRVTDGNLNIESSVFRNNSAKFEGGAVSAGDDNQYSNVHYQLNINNSTFVENKARTGAGIIANDGINLTNSVLSNNSVPNSISARLGLGAGIYVLNGDTTLIGNTIENNTNPYNKWDTQDVYSYQGNVAAKDNDWGSDNNPRIKTNNGKIKDEITSQPTINKPEITIQTGKLLEKKEDETENEHTDNTPTEDNDNKQENNHQNQNNAENTSTTTNQNRQHNTDNQNTQHNTNNQNPQHNPNPNYAPNKENNNFIDNTKAKSRNANNGQSGQNNIFQADYSQNMVRTNTTTSSFDSNPNLGEQSEPTSSSDGKQGPDSQAHELSTKKSTIKQDGSIVPQILLILVVLLAFIIGYKYNKKDN